MCGIVAQTRIKDGGRAFDVAMASLSHRGIRSRVMRTQYGVVGHWRLPIVGLSESYDQPVETSRNVVGFVGEVLNFKDYTASEDSDLPLVVDTWDSRIERFCEFDGFWSVVALDKRTGAIHALVDYLAQKPLYYRCDDELIAISSEPAAIACMARTTPDDVYFSSIMKWGYCPETWRTPYQEIIKMLPGERITLHPTGHVGSRILDNLIPHEWDLRHEIQAAVRRRVRSSDVPVAILVSGGLDSSIVYKLAKNYGPLNPYHVENGELDYAEELIGTPGLVVLQTTIPSTTSKTIRYMQEPIDLGSLEPQIQLSDAIAASGAERVCLTGDGADEFFGGYGRALRYDSQASDVWHELVAWHLPRLDRVMMRNLIEVRSPFLARRVCETALALPWSHRRDKRILRDTFRDVLGDRLADQPKRPLRTKAVENDPEWRRRTLIEAFMKAHWSSSRYAA